MHPIYSQLWMNTYVHRVCLVREALMECLDYLVKLERLVLLVTLGHVVLQVQG